jgi:aminocarboxymuconate-semialdehyde decarboxylase
MKIDLHTHILPERWPDLKARYGDGDWVRLEHHAPCRARLLKGDTFFREIESNCWDPDVRRKDMSAAGVHVQALSTVPVMFSYWAKPQDALDLSCLLNDHIAGVVAAHPSHFVALGTIPMQAPALAVRELERCVKQLGMRGVQIGTNINARNLDDPGVFDVLAAAEALGAGVFIHPWEMLAPERMARYWMGWLVGMPTETTIAMCSLMFSGVLDRLPRLKVCFAHGGGSFPGTIGRISHGRACRPDLFPPGARDPRDYLARGVTHAGVYVDSLVHDADALLDVIRLFGDDRVCLGSDYPFPLGEERPGALVESMHAVLGAKTVERVLAKNAMEFLGMTVAP